MATKNNKKFVFDARMILPVLASVQGANYATAFLMAHNLQSGIVGIDNILNWAVALSGLLMGFGVALVIGLIGTNLPTMGKRAQKGAMIVFVLMLLLSPFVLAPVIVAGMDERLGDVLGGPIGEWTWAIFRSLLPDLAIGGAALIDRNMVGVRESPLGSSGAPVGAEPVPTGNDRKKKNKKQAPIGWPRKCKYCDFMIEVPTETGAHMKYAHPDLCVKKTRPAQPENGG
jgi:hypothetical protein